jgi:hypothetical protein
MDFSQKPLKIPATLAFVVAMYFTWNFRLYLPISDGWAGIEKFLWPLSLTNLVFHEGGHWILGIFGWDFLRVAGGTILQLAMPAICLGYFIEKDNYLGVCFTLFWIGENLINISLYAADAKVQALILITGMSGSEGGMHDWGYLFGAIGMTDYCVGIAQIIFFAGCWLMAFAPAWMVATFCRYAAKQIYK